RLAAEVLLQELRVLIAGAMVQDEIVRVAGHVEHLHLRAAWHELLGELAAVHARHDHVGQEQMDRFRLPIGDRQRLRTMTGLQHGVAVDPERPTHDLANVVFVLHDQDGLGALRRLRRLALRFDHGDRVVDASQVDREGAAAAGLAVDPDRAPTLIHDAVDHRQPESNAPMRATLTWSSMTLGCRTCFRLNATRWLVRSAARSAAFSIPSTSPPSDAWPSRRRRRSSVWPMITVSRLLKSWAMPPARRPTASIFCACRKSSSNCLRSETSTIKPRSFSAL